MRISLLNRPLFNSFFGIMDIKQGALLIVAFGLLNKIAGVYGLFGALFSGGTIGQLSFYLYSTVTLAGFVWGLKAISEEQTTNVFKFSHLYILDHLVTTFYTFLFSIVWWLYIPHDGRRVSNSPAQAAMIALAKSRGELLGEDLSDEERVRIAESLWDHEKIFAVFVLIACWALKIYFALALYSFASHLKHNSYRGLPMTNTSSTNMSSIGSNSAIPMMTTTTSSPNHIRSGSNGREEDEEEGKDVFKWDSEDEEGESSNKPKTSRRADERV
ncbi:Protein of unknown function DUF1753, Golgi [Phaffia rhodozyma]|uniref:DUF1753-domain-containing protein n=1 Tax=Phaffia rhodozyma TaxID=264483 RepID=A0A0F7SP74_PHARH|nr:Protein of unknown function DUF1753, Golgi [Phaffia rhodozyma]